MSFVLVDSRQFGTVRRFYFDAVEEGSRHRVAVEVDIALVHKHKIPLQELPLLCRGRLEARPNKTVVVFTETDMLKYAAERAADKEALALKRPHRAPRRSAMSKPNGEAWRSSLRLKVQ